MIIKMAEHSTHTYKTICPNWIFLNSGLKQDLIHKLFKSIGLSATNGTFVTKGELESNF